MQFLGQGSQKLERKRDRQTDRHDLGSCNLDLEPITLTHEHNLDNLEV